MSIIRNIFSSLCGLFSRKASSAVVKSIELEQEANPANCTHENWVTLERPATRTRVTRSGQPISIKQGVETVEECAFCGETRVVSFRTTEVRVDQDAPILVHYKPKSTLLRDQKPKSRKSVAKQQARV